MPKTIDRTLPIKRYRKVVATTDLPGVPEGTVGKVRVANGGSWYRYWVDFDNGVRMGQVSHADLCLEGAWGRIQLPGRGRAPGRRGPRGDRRNRRR